jgi:hypothetical protein
LGLKVHRDQTECTLTLSQKSYINTIVDWFYLADAKSVQTPMELGLTLSIDQGSGTVAEVQAMQDIPYQMAIGSLMYAATSMCPDLAFPVAMLLQFMCNLGRLHWEATKHALCYLKGTADAEITLGMNEGGLEAFVNAD